MDFVASTTVVLVHLDAAQALFHISINGDVVKVLSIKGLYPGQLALCDYVEILKAEAHFIEQYHITNW